MGETLLDSFCFFSTLCWANGSRSEVLRRAFLASRPEVGDSLNLLVLTVLSAEQERPGNSVPLLEPKEVSAKGSEKFMQYSLLLPSNPSRRSRAGRKSHTGEEESSSGGPCSTTEQNSGKVEAGSGGGDEFLQLALFVPGGPACQHETQRWTDTGTPETGRAELLHDAGFFENLLNPAEQSR